jgi:thiol-disulfide isomerase/thioredoxin
MNKLTSLFLILSFTFNQCTGRENNGILNKAVYEDPSTLVIINLKINEIAAFNYQDKFGNIKQDIYIDIKKDTIIKKRIYTTNPILYNYCVNQQVPILLFPDDTVSFKMTGKNFTCISNKKNSFVINFFANLNESGTSIFLFSNSIKKNNTENQKISLLNYLYNCSMASLLNNKEKLLDSDFVVIKSVIKCEYYKHKLIRYTVSNNTDKLKLQDTINSYIIQNKDNISSSFISLVSTYNQSKWIQNIKTANDAFLMYDSCEYNYTGKLRDRILLDWLYNIKMKSRLKLETYTVRYLSIVTDSNFKRFALENYLTKSFQNDTTDILDLAGKNKALKEIIQQNIGNVIYLDFWASWCIPCRQEMKGNKKFSDYQINGKKIVYIFISIDEIFSNWKEACKAELLTDFKNNYLLKDFNTSKVKDVYNLSTIPRYILINKKGQIVNQNALRPSDPMLKTQLVKLLAE